MLSRFPQATVVSEADLGQLPFFKGAGLTTLAQAAPMANWLSLEANQLVFDYGDDSKEVFLVVHGSLRVLVRTALGQETILDDLRDGDLFGDIAAIDEARRSASVVALSRTRLCRLPVKTFMDAIL